MRSRIVASALTVAAILLSGLCGYVLANDDEFDDDPPMKADFNQNLLWDHYDVNWDGHWDLWDENEDDWVDSWDDDNDGIYTSFALLAATYTPHVGMVCFADSTTTCNCKLQRTSGWTCYIDSTQSNCYDENSNSQTNLDKAEVCKLGKVSKRYEKC